jgi:hypothetical protein
VKLKEEEDIEQRTLQMLNIKYDSVGRPYFITRLLIDEDTEFIYYRNKSNPDDWGSELYVGENYVLGSTKKSYSKVYPKWKGLPKKYKKYAKPLKDANMRLWR